MSTLGSRSTTTDRGVAAAMDTTDTVTDDQTAEDDDGATQDLGDRLYQIQRDTTDDGRVRVTIESIDEVVDPNRGRREGIDVTYRFPSGRTGTEEMDLPEPATDEFKFVRLARRLGFEPHNTDELEGAMAEAEKVDGEWKLHAPKPKDRIATLKDIVATVTFFPSIVLGLVTAPINIPLSHFLLKPSERLCFEDFVVFYIGTTLLWLLVVAGVYSVVVL